MGGGGDFRRKDFLGLLATPAGTSQGRVVQLDTPGPDGGGFATTRGGAGLFHAKKGPSWAELAREKSQMPKYRGGGIDDSTKKPVQRARKKALLNKRTAVKVSLLTKVRTSRTRKRETKKSIVFLTKKKGFGEHWGGKKENQQQVVSRGISQPHLFGNREKEGSDMLRRERVLMSQANGSSSF